VTAILSAFRSKMAVANRRWKGLRVNPREVGHARSHVQPLSIHDILRGVERFDPHSHDGRCGDDA